jgi:hypothetical protein
LEDRSRVVALVNGTRKLRFMLVFGLAQRRLIAFHADPERGLSLIVA